MFFVSKERIESFPNEENKFCKSHFLLLYRLLLFHFVSVLFENSYFLWRYS